VHYKVALERVTAHKTLGVIVKSIKTEAKNGTFGDFEVDVDSISGSAHQDGQSKFYIIILFSKLIKLLELTYTIEF